MTDNANIPSPPSAINRYSLTVLFLMLAMWPAFYNGYPLVFHDSTQYLWFAQDPIGAREIHSGYNAYYPWFISPALFFSTLWIVPLFQAIIAIFVLTVFFKNYIGSGSTKKSAGLLGITFCITQLPWLNVWLVPDVFAGLGFFAMCLLLFRPVQKLQSRTTNCLILVAVFGALMSMGNFLAYLSAAAFIYLLKYLLGSKLMIARAVSATALVLGTLCLILLPNLVLYGKLTANNGSAALVFARFVEVGLAQDYLHSHCEPPIFLVCNQLGKLDVLKGQRQGFLWGEDKLANTTDAWLDPQGEFARLDRSIIFNNITGTAIHVSASAGELLSMSSLGEQVSDGNLMTYPETGPVWKYIHRVFPNEAATFDESRQQLGTFDIALWNKVYEISQSLSYLLIPAGLLWAMLRRNWQMVGLISCAIVYVVASAFVHAGLVGPFARYQVKAAWVFWPIILVAFSQLHEWRQKRRDS